MGDQRRVLAPLCMDVVEARARDLRHAIVRPHRA